MVEVPLTNPWSKALPVLSAQGLWQTSGEAGCVAMKLESYLPCLRRQGRVVTCRLIFSIEEADPSCKMMPHRSYIIEERESEPVFKDHIPYGGHSFRDCKPKPFKIALDFWTDIHKTCWNSSNLFIDKENWYCFGCTTVLYPFKILK